MSYVIDIIIVSVFGAGAVAFLVWYFFFSPKKGRCSECSECKEAILKELNSRKKNTKKERE